MLLFRKLAIIFVMVAAATHLSAQTDKVTETSFKVEGLCGQCKERIENAAYIKGVKFAEWDKKTKMLKVVFRKDKTTVETIQKAIAKAGHDTGEFKADDETYNNLPACCAYRSENVHTH